MIDAKKTMERLRGERDRTNKTLYLSQSLFAEFESYCGEISPSKVIEELMKEFIESSKKSRPKGKKKN